MNHRKQCRPVLTALALGRVLLGPPIGGPPTDTMVCTGCGDPGHSDDAAPLDFWIRRGAFADGVECRRYRDERIVNARSDQEWSDWQSSRCFPRNGSRRAGCVPANDGVSAATRV